nr:restriction endonuclease subunit S [Neomicrococcus lactis]
MGDCILSNTGGGTPSKASPEFWNGEIPWASVGDITSSNLKLAYTRQSITPVGLQNSSSHVIQPGSVVVAIKMSPGAMRVVAKPVAINQDIRGLVLQPDLDPYFLTYFFTTMSIVGNGTIVRSITSSELEKIKVPVPPLEVQQEIVRILDQFTQLEAELDAELEARRRQFSAYRKELLSTDFDELTRARIGDVLDLKAGKFISASEILPNADETHTIPCFGGGGLRGFVAEGNHEGDHVLIGRQGALCGNVKRSSGSFYATEHAVVVTPGSGIDLSWSYHLLTFMDLNRYASKSAQPGLAVGTLNQLEISIPSFEEQSRIGRILDSFESLTESMSNGLPAEIGARRKQYEYYRDKLLTFKELAA